MKSVTMSCPCGARVEFHDDAESLIDPDGVPDSKGRRFLIELRTDEWLDRHNPCLEARISAAKSLQEKGKKKS